MQKPEWFCYTLNVSFWGSGQLKFAGWCLYQDVFFELTCSGIIDPIPLRCQVRHVGRYIALRQNPRVVVEELEQLILDIRIRCEITLAHIVLKLASSAT